MTITNETFLSWIYQLEALPQMDLHEMLSKKNVAKFVKNNGKLIQATLDRGFEISSRYFEVGDDGKLLMSTEGGLTLREGKSQEEYEAEYNLFLQDKLTVTFKYGQSLQIRLD